MTPYKHAESSANKFYDITRKELGKNVTLEEY
jgi:hypothetical protein